MRVDSNATLASAPSPELPGGQVAAFSQVMPLV